MDSWIDKRKWNKAKRKKELREREGGREGGRKKTVKEKNLIGRKEPHPFFNLWELE